jgi:hypothetical protein
MGFPSVRLFCSTSSGLLLSQVVEIHVFIAPFLADTTVIVVILCLVG